MRKKVFVIVGPTASGKTELAHYVNDLTSFPIINADAYQIYKDMNIGTAKIKENDPYFLKYHLLSYVSPNLDYSIYHYQKDFRLEFEKIMKDNLGAIIVGGSGLYIKSSLYDYKFSKDKKEIEEDYSSLTNEELYDKIKEIDKDALDNIHINNRRRLIRCLSICLSNNENKSDLINSQKHELYYKDYDFYFVFLNPNREQLYENINKRTIMMFNEGLIDEVSHLIKNYDLSNPAKMAAGYLESIRYLNQEISLETAIELTQKRTRNLAKRQITFFKHQLPCKEFDNLDIAKEYIKDNI
ncbi:MAG: tRNA (adenosine(37)-N6)-dimethylallyltransferase MiaA [Bacilli bacterium]